MILSQLKTIFSSQLRLNMLSGPVTVGLGILVSAVKFPLYIHFLGYEQYGIWLLLSIILAFAEMGLLGIETAIVKLVAEEYAQNNNKAIQEYFMTAICMLMVSGVILVGSSILFKEQIIELIGLKGENAELADGLLVYMVLFSIGVLAYQVLNSVLAGIGRIDLANYYKITKQVLPLIISVPLLMAGKGVVSLLLANVFAYLIVSILNFVRVNKTVNVNPLQITSCSWRRFKKMITFGGTVFAGYMLNMIVLPFTKIVITRTIGVEGVPVIELAYRISMQFRSLFQVALSALMPEISKLSAQQSHESTLKMKKIKVKANQLLLLGATPLYILFFILTDLIFKLWLGDNLISSLPGVFRVMLISSFISLIGVIPYYFFMGQGFTRKIFINHAIDAGCTLLLIGSLASFISEINLIAVAWCFVAGTTCGTGYLLLASEETMKLYGPKQKGN